MNKRIKNILAVAAALVMVLQSMSGMAFADAPKCKEITGTSYHEVNGAGTACGAPGAAHIFNFVNGTTTYDGTDLTGTNYYYVPLNGTVRNVVVNCGTGEDIIYIFGNAAAADNGKIQIFNYSTSDEIRFIDTATLQENKLTSAPSEGKIEFSSGGVVRLTVEVYSSTDTAEKVPVTGLAVGNTVLPLIATTQPTGGSFKQGEACPELKFEAYHSAANNPNVTYQWYTSTDTKIEGATASAYTPFTGSTGGVAAGTTSYYCIASALGFADLKSQTATVTVTEPPTPTCAVTATIGLTITPSADPLPVDSGGAQVTFSVPVTFAGACDVAGHTAALHGYTVDWAVTGGNGAITPTSVTTTNASENGFTSSAFVTVKSTDINGATGAVTATATLKKDGAAVAGGTAAKTITVNASSYCTYPIASGLVTGPQVFNVLNQTAAGTFTLTDLGYGINGTCNISTHTASDHKKTCGWKLMSASTGGTELGVNNGFTLTSAGDNKVTLTVDKSKLSGVNQTVYLVATSNGNNINFATYQIQINACKSDYGSASVANPSQIPVRDVTSVNTISLDSFLTGVPSAATCGIAGHRHVTWSITTNVNGCASITAGTDTLVIDKAKLPAEGGRLKLHYVTTGVETSHASGDLYIDLTRNKICTKTLTGISGSTAITARNATTTQSYSAVFNTGWICEETSHSHTVTWSVTGLPTGSSITSGINASTGVLTLKKTELTASKYTLTITATFVGASGNQTKTTTVTVTKGTATSGSSSSSNKEEWQDIDDAIDDAKSGSTVRRSLGSNTDVPYYVWETLRGQNVTLEMIFGKYTWSVNGKTVKRLPDYQIYIPMGVKEISNSDIAKLARGYDVTILELEHEGSFYADMRLTFYAGSEYANKTLYLYYYNSSTNKLTYRTSAKANSDGDVTFPFTSASTYLVTSYALYGESTTTSGGGTINSGGTTSSSTPAASVSSGSSSSSSGSSSSSSSTSESSSSSSSSSSSLSSSPASVPTGADADPEKEKQSIPFLVPVLVAAIVAVIVAILLIAKKNRA